MLGGVVERLMNRLDSIEQRLQAPTYEPARAPDHMSGVLQTLKMAQQIRELLDPTGDDDDDEDEEPAGQMPTDPQSLAMMLLAKKLSGDDAGDLFPGMKPPQPQAPAQPQAPRPRLIKGGQEPGAPLDAAAILAALQQLPPAERARLVNEVGSSLDAETLAEMAAQMQAQQGAADAG
jgi:hypothetical protein